MKAKQTDDKQDWEAREHLGMRWRISRHAPASEKQPREFEDFHQPNSPSGKIHCIQPAKGNGLWVGPLSKLHTGL